MGLRTMALPHEPCPSPAPDGLQDSHPRGNASVDGGDNEGSCGACPPAESGCGGSSDSCGEGADASDVVRRCTARAREHLEMLGGSAPLRSVGGAFGVSEAQLVEAGFHVAGQGRNRSVSLPSDPDSDWPARSPQRSRGRSRGRCEQRCSSGDSSHTEGSVELCRPRVRGRTPAPTAARGADALVGAPPVQATELRLGATVAVVSPSGFERNCTVVGVDGGQVKLHYDGFDAKHDEWLPRH